MRVSLKLLNIYPFSPPLVAQATELSMLLYYNQTINTIAEGNL